MPSFQPLFMKSKGQPISYLGDTLLLIDSLIINPDDKLLITFEKINSPWKQGIKLRLKGKISVADNWIDTHKEDLIFWQDTAPMTFTIIVRPDKSEPLKIHNIWDTGDGVTQSWHYGAAMKVEDLPDGKRYYCNDGHPDDNFDDIVFSIRKLG